MGRILRACFLLCVVVMFNDRSHCRIFGNGAHINFSLTFRFLRFFMNNTSVRSIRRDPICVRSNLWNLIMSISFANYDTYASALNVHVIRHSYVSNERVGDQRVANVYWYNVIVTSLFFVANSACKVVIYGSFLRAFFRHVEVLHVNKDRPYDASAWDCGSSFRAISILAFQLMSVWLWVTNAVCVIEGMSAGVPPAATMPVTVH